MSVTATQTFEEWFEGEKRRGLKDVKLAIGQKRGASLRLVQDDLMTLDALVEAGLTVSPLPLADAVIPDKIAATIDAVSI